MNIEVEGRAAAELYRRKHHLGIQPLGDLVAVIHDRHRRAPGLRFYHFANCADARC